MHDLAFSSFGFHPTHFIRSVKIISGLDLVLHCCGRSSQPGAGTSHSSGCPSFCTFCQPVLLEAWQKDALPEARLTMSFLLPSPICLAVAFHSESLSSYLPVTLLLGAPQTHFRFYFQYGIWGESHKQHLLYFGN